MTQQGGRNIALMVWKNFINSIRPNKPKGKLIGQDYLGTSYYEIPADPQRGKRKPSRWFETKCKNSLDAFDQELPPEWEAWLRGRRAEPPTDQEIMKNLAIMNTKKDKAKELEDVHKSTVANTDSQLPASEEKSSFPLYPEYEVLPGKSREKK